MSLRPRNHLRFFVALFLLILAAPSVCAMPFGIDHKVGEANLGNSGDAAEKQALADILGVDVSTLVQDQKIDNANSLAVANGTDSWYIDVNPNTPGWFLLKFGTGGINPSPTADHFYFKNIAELDKLVWRNDQVQNLSGGGGNNTNIGRLSHYTTYDPNSVPEPLTLGLMGIGLIGVGGTRRLRKAA